MTRTSKPPPRLFVDAPLDRGKLGLDADQAHYLGRVLRCREGDRIRVFNARGRERDATIESLARRHPVVSLGDDVAPVPDSGARIVLLQAIVKSDAMDLIVQKATELGVAALYAVKTDFSVVRLDDARRDRRLAHWARIALSACEQSGRHRPPAIETFASLDAAIAALPADAVRIAFDVGATQTLAAALGRASGIRAAAGDAGLASDAAAGPESGTLSGPAPICIAIGPEGGFSPDESDYLDREGFALCTLGPRTLRAETAAIAAAACVQLLRGDLVRPPG